jgi:hypothetical protein
VSPKSTLLFSASFNALLSAREGIFCRCKLPDISAAQQPVAYQGSETEREFSLHDGRICVPRGVLYRRESELKRRSRLQVFVQRPGAGFDAQHRGTELI